MKKHIVCWLNNQDGATAIEYGLIAAGISLVIVASVFLLGDELADLFDSLLAVLS